MNFGLFDGTIMNGQVVTYSDDIIEIRARDVEESIPLWGNTNRLALNRGEGYRVVRNIEVPINNRPAVFLELEGFEGERWPINMFRRGGTLARPAPNPFPETLGELVAAAGARVAWPPQDVPQVAVNVRETFAVGGRDPRQVPANPWAMMIQDRPDDDRRAELARMREALDPQRAMPRTINLGFDVPHAKKKAEPAPKYGVDYS